MAAEATTQAGQWVRRFLCQSWCPRETKEADTATRYRWQKKKESRRSRNTLLSTSY